MTRSLVTTAGEMLKAVRLARAPIQRWSSIPILEYVHIDRNKITGTDLDIEVTATFYALSAELKACIHAVELLHVLEGVQRDTVIRFTPAGENKIAAQFDGAVYFLSSLPADDFPFMSFTKLPVRVDVKNDGLSAAMKRVRYAISTEETRYYLNGVCLWKHENGRCAIVATDGHQLALQRLACELPFEKQIIPSRALNFITSRSGEPSAMTLADAKAGFEWPDVSMMTKLIDGYYPDIARVMPKQDEPATSIFLPKRQTMAALNRATNCRTGGFPKCVSFRACPGGLFISNYQQKGADRLHIEQVTGFEPDSLGGQTITFAVNAPYLLSMLGADRGPDAFELKYAGEGKPLYHARPDGMSVLMPARQDVPLTEAIVESLMSGNPEAIA